MSRHQPRAYMRHPADIPIRVEPRTIEHACGRKLKDIGLGGLACRSEQSLPIGTPVEVSIELVSPPFHATGRVAWCRQVLDHHELGIQFLHANDAFAARMVEQVCHIEHYRLEVLRTEGRVLDGSAAAREWIRRFAEHFPSMHSFRHPG